MGRSIAGVIGGLITWILVATIANLVMRMAWAGYSEAEPAMHFTLAMMIARLFVGALSSLGAGFVVAWITNRNGRAIYVLVGILVVLFIPVHYKLWEVFPIWYHIAFFASLALMAPAGAMLDRHNGTKHSHRLT
jgi:hypothetical protein